MNENEEIPYKDQALKAAKDLHYGEKNIKMIKDAKSDAGISRIMMAARKEKFGD